MIPIFIIQSYFKYLITMLAYTVGNNSVLGHDSFKHN